MRLLLGFGSCGLAAGALTVSESMQKVLADTNLQLTLVGCNGMCFAEPLLQVIDDAGENYYYGNLNEDIASNIAKALLAGQIPQQNLLMQDANDFLAPQTRVALAHCGLIDPENIEEYLWVGGYTALKKAVLMNLEEIIAEVKLSGLRGRGGAGFPTWLKWQNTRLAPGKEKFLICNADEGDPGAFMDRSLLESDPHSVIEGMVIAARAIGATQGIIYVRREYPLAVKRIGKAILQAKNKGFLGDNICGSDFNFNLRLVQGAGAFICGEETALIASLSGKRGMPTFKPPYPSERGYHDLPTNINNVETFANIAWIINNGGLSFGDLSNDENSGTKVFALTGKIKRGGLVEVPLGTTFSKVIYEIGGGLKNGKEAKAIQIGGPSGGCLPGKLLSTLKINYEELASVGAIMGSGGLVVMDDSTCMVDIARFFMAFNKDESCGRCTPCRIGMVRLEELLTEICQGQGKEEYIPFLETLGKHVKSTSLCGLGNSAPNPLLTTMRYFPEEYAAHIKEKRCPALKCQALLDYSIDEEKCTGCGQCFKVCSAGAISGMRKQAYHIDSSLCIKCGMCQSSCLFDAVKISSKGVAM